MQPDWQKYLASVYFDPSHPGSFAGPEKLYKIVKSEGRFKIGKHRIAKWLSNQDAYSLTKGVRRKFDRSRVIVEGLDSQWDVDLMDMKDLASENRGLNTCLLPSMCFRDTPFANQPKVKPPKMRFLRCKNYFLDQEYLE